MTTTTDTAIEIAKLERALLDSYGAVAVLLARLGGDVTLSKSELIDIRGRLLWSEATLDGGMTLRLQASERAPDEPPKREPLEMPLQLLLVDTAHHLRDARAEMDGCEHPALYALSCAIESLLHYAERQAAREVRP